MITRPLTFVSATVAPGFTSSVAAPAAAATKRKVAARASLRMPLLTWNARRGCGSATMRPHAPPRRDRFAAFDRVAARSLAGQRTGSEAGQRARERVLVRPRHDSASRADLQGAAASRRHLREQARPRADRRALPRPRL